MSLTARPSVALLEGNATLARIISETLRASALEVVKLSGPPPGAEGARLVIVDVDSAGVDARRWLHFCEERQLPVLVCGVASSRAHFAQYPWLGRPFTTRQLERVCEELLRDGSPPRRSHSVPGAIEVRDPVTVEMEGEDASDLEVELGLSPGTLGGQVFEDDDFLEMIDVDTTGSMILEIEDLPGGLGQGGVLVGGARRESLDAARLEAERSRSAEVDVTIDEVISPSTFPEVPAGIEVPTIGGDATAISVVAPTSQVDRITLHQVAHLLAEHWERVGLSARATDRAERLERLLGAMVDGGIDRVAEELRRVPNARGFSGQIETLSVVDLLHTLRERRLRGRLEVSLPGRSFVLYVDGNVLHEIESLGESTDGMLLEVLRAEGAVDEGVYQRLSHDLRTGQFEEGPLEMFLRREQIVDDLRLLDARKGRARRLLGEICGGRRGGFAFIEVARDSSFAWPTRGLDLKIDTLLLEIMREVSLDTGHSEATARTRLVLDAGRAASVDPRALTDDERQLLSFFEEGQTLGEARARLATTGEESVDRVVQRLKRMELLKRKSSAGEVIVKRPSGPHERPTAVSNWEIDIPDLDRSHHIEVGAPESSDEEETHQERGYLAGAPFEEDAAMSWDEELDSIFRRAADTAEFDTQGRDDDDTK
ncbi:DUF4388 domain-containing protein [Lujinxingia vulgaris]|uniref:DUF4388 domain-containing protein n=1 Tax=Lujinxingia vulgaris TaxID=2600176 RepID=UPI001E495D9D|nr:DUF4388 domain-containing protein [Lujinxingia vulgaris]